MPYRPARALLLPTLAGFTAALALTLTGCTLPADPSVTREALQEVVDPAPAVTDGGDVSEPVAEEPIELEPLECLPYLVVTARGTGEPNRGQLLSPVARTISEARPDQVLTVNLDYPADTDVNGGGTLGVRTLVTMLNLQAQTCPEQKFVLLGYSQGAMVVGDALSEAPDRLLGEQAEELRPEAEAAVSAVVFYGDPRFVGSASYNEGSYDETRDGLLPRSTTALDAYAKRMRDYCVGSDFICQASTTDLDESGHVEYYDNGMQQDGAAFAITKLAPLTKPAKEKAQSGSGTKPAEVPADTE